MTTDLAVREEVTTNAMVSIRDLPDPEEYMGHQAKIAKAVMKVISEQGDNKGKWVTDIQGKEYLHFEAWQTIAIMNGCTIYVESTEEVYVDDKLVAIRAWASVRTMAGGIAARAVMECAMDAFPTQGKSGRDKYKAAESAAQTWAGSKACRMAFSFVAVLAGYQATTAEEMQESSGGSGDFNERGEFGLASKCPEHDVAYFKTEKMRGHAHKMDGNKWCNYGPAKFGEMVKERFEQIGWSKEDLASHIKNDIGAPNWSGLLIGQMGQLLDDLDKMIEEKEAAPEAPAETQPPLVDEATGEIIAEGPPEPVAEAQPEPQEAPSEAPAGGDAPVEATEGALPPLAGQWERFMEYTNTLGWSSAERSAWLVEKMGADWGDLSDPRRAVALQQVETMVAVEALPAVN